MINGIETSRSVKEVRTYNTQNIKSVKQTTPFGGSNDFKADSILDRFNFPGSISQLVINLASGSPNISTVTSPGRTFIGINTDTVIRYQQTGLSQKLIAEYLVSHLIHYLLKFLEYLVLLEFLMDHYHHHKFKLMDF